MNRKVRQFIEPNSRLYFIMLILFALSTAFFGRSEVFLAAVQLFVVILLYLYYRISNRRKRYEMLQYIESVTSNLDSATKDTLTNFPLPMVIISLDKNELIYANDSFLSVSGEHEHSFSVSISDIVPNFSVRWLMEGKNECPELVSLNDRYFRVFGSLVRSSDAPGVKNYVATTYWIDETQFAQLNDVFENSRIVFSTVIVDNYDELTSGLSDKDKTTMISQIDDILTNWTAPFNGYFSRTERDRYIFIFENRHLQSMIDSKFSILDSVRELVSSRGMHPTISIGFGKDGADIAENHHFASLALEMALSRGGDQAVIKNKFTFDFYGGKSNQTEKRTKVKSRVMANSLTELMRDASEIFIMGHKYSDLDSVGSAIGVCCAARTLGKNAHIVIDKSTSVAKELIDKISSLPEYEKVFMDPQDAIIQVNGTSLLVVVDTNRPEQVESDSLLEACNKIALIDHHRRAATYIQNAALSLHEPYASSTSELVTELLQYMVDQSDILRNEAEALMAGIILDTKNFTIQTGGRTFDAAAFLRRAGADPSEVKELLNQDLESTTARYAIIQGAKVYKAGMAIAAPPSAENRVIASQAADELLNVTGIRASFVVFPSTQSVDITARSLGEINVQVILEKLGGGGSKSQAGAQITGKTQKEVVQDLLTAIDNYLDETIFSEE